MKSNSTVCFYTTIRNTYLLFEGLNAETPYSFKVRAVNKDGVSDWATIQVTTKANPLEFAIHGIEGESTAASQGGFGVNRLFDFAESGRQLAYEVPCECNAA